MVLQGHNSWSYIRPKKWFFRLISFVAKCQKADIYSQYEDYGVGSYDLRVRFDKDGNMIIAHGIVEFDIDYNTLIEHLKFIDSKACIVRVLHEVRNKKQYTEESLKYFKEFCQKIEEMFPNIKFYCGKNLYNWEIDYQFKYDFSEEGVYSSVCPPKIIDDWFPWLFARFHNHETLEKGTDKDILSIDFVNIQ